MLVNQAGEIITDTAPFTFPMLNEAAEYMQNKLQNRGMNTFTKETFISQEINGHSISPMQIVPAGGGSAAPGTDPGLQVNLSDTGYFDAAINWNPPQLPTDLITPTDLWERQSETTEAWIPMTRYLDGLPSIVQTTRLRAWEWRTEAIYMPGATQTNDLRIRYESANLQYVTVADSVQIRGSTSALANLLAAIFVNSRNPGAGAGFAAAGDEFINQMCIRNTRSKQRVTKTRQSYGRNTAAWK